MNTLATVNNEPKSEKKQRISKRLHTAISLIVRGEVPTYKAACERVGMDASYFSQALQKPHVRVFYERCARESIAAGVMRAAARINNLVDASSEHVSFDAAKHVLGIAGIKPAAEAQVSVSIDMKAGYIIDLSEPDGTYRDSMSRQEGNEIKDITLGKP